MLNNRRFLVKNICREIKNMEKIIIIFFSFMFALSASADSLDDTLKSDFSKQETIKIRFEVNKRLFSFEAGKFKIENIKKNKDKIRAITDRIIPWAIMEHMTPPEVARIIVYMYHADEAGAPYLDAEDLIPLVAQYEIPLKDFVLMVQYNKETKKAAIPEEIRDAFLGYAFSKSWDGVSILAGGRGLIIAKLLEININKTASLLLKNLPAKGAKANAASLVSIIENIIGESVKEKNAQLMMNNFASAQKSFTQTENSPQGLKTILESSSKSEAAVKNAGNVNIPAQIAKNDKIDKETGIINDESHKNIRENWQILSTNNLYEIMKPWLGTPYKYGNKTGKPGIDCSGFTRIVLVNPKIGVPSDLIGFCSGDQSKAGSPVSRQNIRAGDLLFFSASPDAKKITHVALATSPGYFTHASTRGVVNDDLNKKWWSQRYVASRRLFTDVRK
jgi:cell wall-associated NlpC family hydrolase